MTTKPPPPDKHRGQGDASGAAERASPEPGRASPRSDRRTRRSTNLILALRYWLESSVRRSGAAGLTLADGDGFLLASSLPSAHGEEVAALAPLLALTDRQGHSFADNACLPIAILEMSSFCGRLFLCATGDEERRGEALRASRGGVQRIIKELTGAPAWSLALDGGQ